MTLHQLKASEFHVKYLYSECNELKKGTFLNDIDVFRKLPSKLNVKKLFTLNSSSPHIKRRRFI